MSRDNTKQLSFEDVPRVLGEIYDLVSELSNKNSSTEPEGDRLMPMSEYLKYIEQKLGKKPARQTVYEQVFKRLIPFEKHGKFLYFRKSAIDAWLANGRQI